MWSTIATGLWKLRVPLALAGMLTAAYCKGGADNDAKWRTATEKQAAEWALKVSEADKAAYKNGVLDAIMDERNKDIVDDIKDHAAKEPGASDECLSADTVERLRSIQ